MEIRLHNAMKHVNYSFPESVVRYQLPSDMGEAVVQYQGEIIPSQRSGEFICFSAALAGGEEKIFEVSQINETVQDIADEKRTAEDKTAEDKTAQDISARQERCKFPEIASQDDGSILLRNPYMTVTIDAGREELFVIEKDSVIGRALTDRRILSKQAVLLENGPVFAKVSVIAELDQGEKYELTLTLEGCKEYLVLDENLTPAVPGVHRSASMQLVWSGFYPQYRQVSFTDSERAERAFYADEYTDADGRVLHKLIPYDQSHGMESTTYMAFLANNLGVGVFAGDIHRWNDGSYRIEGCNGDNAVRAYCRFDGAECKLRFAYPLYQGTRQTCIALYDGTKQGGFASYQTCDALFSEQAQGSSGSYISQLSYYYRKMNLNEYKDWDLDWQTPQEQYPVFFDKNKMDMTAAYTISDGGCGIPDAAYLWDKIRHDRMYQCPWSIGPVVSRRYCDWAAVFDLTAADMTPEDYAEVKRTLLFGAYYCARENFMPIETTLAGHPNFLIDAVAIVGLCAALFTDHPMALYWKEYYEKCVALVLKFHIRPEVKLWNAQGGRPTESQGTYLFGCLNHMFIASFMVAKVYGDNPALYENIRLLADWVLNMMTAPVDGSRLVPFTGSHAGGHYLNPYYPLYHVRLLGYLMMDYDPLLGEYLLGICPKEPVYGHETGTNKRDIWDFNVYDHKYAEEVGLQPPLKSAKYTGYGYNLRSHVGEKDEMFVLLQQIDVGQNYRWGRAAQGGCGNIHYYAAGKMYSGIRKEDIGDDNMRDEDVGCNFSVLVNQKFKCIGRNDLTNPLIDFDFVKYARIDAGEYSSYDYKYRSVMMVDNRYIVILDSVRDIRTYGRFTWSNYKDEEMPRIYQLSPGATPVYSDAPPMTLEGSPVSQMWAEDQASPIHREVRRVTYDGFGSFLTLVTHRKDLDVKRTPYGALVNDTDYIFDAAYTGRYEEQGIEFSGRVGLVRRCEDGFEAALIEGRSMAVDGIGLDIVKGCGSLSMRKRGDEYYLNVETESSLTIQLKGDFADYRLYPQIGLKGSDEAVYITDKVTLSAGGYCITCGLPKPEKVHGIRYTEEPGGVCLQWHPGAYAERYECRVSAELPLEMTAENVYLNLKLPVGRYIVQLRGVNADRSGEWSEEYPVYVTGQIPAKVEGLRVKIHPTGTEVCWGKKLGVKCYRLYRDGNCIYEGTENSYWDEDTGEYMYYVTAENGYGESDGSVIRDSRRGGLAYFDPMPEVRFVRDTVVNLHGHNDLDYQYNENRRQFMYP